MRVGQHLACNRVLPQKVLEPVAKFSPVLWPSDQALIENDTDAHVSAFQRNPPTPPPVSHHMIGGGAANPVGCASPFGIFLGKFVAIPVFHAFPATPCCGNRMSAIRLPPTLLPCQECGHPRG